MDFSKQEYTGVSCPFLLQRIFLDRGSNPRFLHWQADSLPLSPLGSPFSSLPRLACYSLPLLLLFWRVKGDPQGFMAIGIHGHRQSLSSFPVEFSPERLTLPFFFSQVWMEGWEDMHTLRAAGLCTPRSAPRSGGMSPLHGM